MFLPMGKRADELRKKKKKETDEINEIKKEEVLRLIS